MALDEGGYIIAGEDCVTSTPGIFAAGDIRTKQLRQVVTAGADGANAVISAEKYCDVFEAAQMFPAWKEFFRRLKALMRSGQLWMKQ